MNINNICDEYKKVYYAERLKKEIEYSFKVSKFDDIGLTNYSVIILHRYSKDIKDWEYEEINNKDAVRGFILNSYNNFVNNFKISEMYEDYSYANFYNDFVHYSKDYRYSDVFLSVNTHNLNIGKRKNILY